MDNREGMTLERSKTSKGLEKRFPQVMSIQVGVTIIVTEDTLTIEEMVIEIEDRAATEDAMTETEATEGMEGIEAIENEDSEETTEAEEITEEVMTGNREEIEGTGETIDNRGRTGNRENRPNRFKKLRMNID